MQNGLMTGVHTPNWSVSDKEGINGLDFVSARDQRVNIDPEGSFPVAARQNARPIFNHYKPTRIAGGGRHGDRGAPD